MKVQGKPGTIRELSLILTQIKEKSSIANRLVHISFSSSLFMVVRKWLFHLLTVNMNRTTLHNRSDGPVVEIGAALCAIGRGRGL